MFQLKTLRNSTIDGKGKLLSTKRGEGWTRGKVASVEVQMGVFHEGDGGIIIINDRPCKYKIKSKSLVTKFKFTRNKGKAIRLEFWPVKYLLHRHYLQKHLANVYTVILMHAKRVSVKMTLYTICTPIHQSDSPSPGGGAINTKRYLRLRLQLP